MAKAKKLPSGNWRVQMSMDGERRSFTAPTKKEAELMALEWVNGKEEQKIPAVKKTVGQAVEEYIQSKENLLSPSSTRGYWIIYNNSIDLISSILLSDITEKHLQNWINSNAAHYAAKSVKSQFGLVRAALRQNKIKIDFESILLPRQSKEEKIIPDEKQISIILHIVEHTSVELPVTIAVTLGLRQSEIAALKWIDYDGKYLYIHAAVVPNKENKYIYKNTTKTEASTRKIEVDALLKERLDRAERKGEFISPMLPSSVLRKFSKLCEQNGLPHFTMHAQRHGNASMMLAKGVPDRYAMKRLGHASTNMIKNVYQHLYGDVEKEVAQTVSDAFSEIFNNGKSADGNGDAHENSHEKK
jgi:integrase